MENATAMIIDLVILAALGATMYRAWQLSRQFEALQADRKAFEQMIQSLNLAASRAEAAIRGMKEAAAEAGDRLQDRINKARALSDELEIMVQAGDNLAERLNKLAEGGRKAASPAEEPATAPRTRAEKELMDALKAKQGS